MKLYDIFNVVDNKSMGKDEDLYKRFRKSYKEYFGIMVKKNSG